MSVNVGSISVDVVPDMRRLIADLKAKAKELSLEIGVSGNLDRLRTQLAEESRARTVTLDVNANTTAAALRLDEISRDRRVNITADANTSSFSKISQALGGISGLTAGIAALGPALIPITAAVVGMGAALGAPLLAAGGGLTVGALIAGFAVKGTEKQLKVIDALSKKVSASQQALASASTPAGKKSAQAQLAADTLAYKNALSALSPAQKTFLNAQGNLKGAFDTLLSKSGNAILGPLTQGMNALANILPKLAPLLTSVSGAISTLLTDVSKAASGPGFTKFIALFGRQAASSIVSFGRIFGNFAKGLFNLFEAFTPLSTGFIKGLTSISRGFANWASTVGGSKGFQSFLAYVKDVGPKVADTFGHLVTAIVKIASALAPLGSLILGLVDGFAKLIASASPTQLNIIAGAIAAVALAVAALGGPVVLLVPAIVATAAGLARAYKSCKPFRDVVQSLAGWVKTDLLPALESAAKRILPALVSGFDSVRTSVQQNQGLFKALGDLLKLTGDYITKFLIPGFAAIASVALPLLGKAIGAAITNVRLLALAFVSMALFAVSGFKDLYSAALNTFDGILKAAVVGLGWIPKIGDKIKGARAAFDSFKDTTIGNLDKTSARLKKFQDELAQATKPRTLKITVGIYGTAAARDLISKGKGGAAKADLLSGARASGGPVSAGNLYRVNENGPGTEVFQPNTDGRVVPLGPGGGRQAPQVNIEKVVAQDFNDFLRQAQTRARHAASDGIAR